MSEDTKTAESLIFYSFFSPFNFSKINNSEIHLKLEKYDISISEHNVKMVAELWKLYNEIKIEVSKWRNSDFYIGSNKPYAALEDFDYEKMTTYFHEMHPQISRNDMESFVRKSIFQWYQR